MGGDAALSPSRASAVLGGGCGSWVLHVRTAVRCLFNSPSGGRDPRLELLVPKAAGPAGGLANPCPVLPAPGQVQCCSYALLRGGLTRDSGEQPNL